MSREEPKTVSKLKYILIQITSSSKGLLLNNLYYYHDLGKGRKLVNLINFRDHPKLVSCFMTPQEPLSNTWRPLIGFPPKWNVSIISLHCSNCQQYKYICLVYSSKCLSMREVSICQYNKIKLFFYSSRRQIHQYPQLLYLCFRENQERGDREII